LSKHSSVKGTVEPCAAVHALEVAGDEVGGVVGGAVGEMVGESVGAVGDVVGDTDGDSVGELVGDPVGESVGEDDGGAVGDDVVGESVSMRMQSTIAWPTIKMDAPLLPQPVFRSASVPMDVTDVGMAIVVTPERANAPRPMVASCEPASTVTVVRLVHPANAKPSIAVNCEPASNVTPVSVVHPV
jgi:hypothetical protein